MLFLFFLHLLTFVLILFTEQIVEFDKPSVLMARTDSVFAGMMSVAEASEDFLL